MWLFCGEQPHGPTLHVLGKSVVFLQQMLVLMVPPDAVQPLPPSDALASGDASLDASDDASEEASNDASREASSEASVPGVASRGPSDVASTAASAAASSESDEDELQATTMSERPRDKRTRMGRVYRLGR